MTEQPDLFPAFLKLKGRHVVVVGAGAVAAQKLQSLVRAQARVTVVAPEVRPEIAQADVTIVRRPFAPRDLDGAWYVVAAAPPDVNREVAAAAEARRIFINAVDDPANASAYAGAVLRRGAVTVAISTGGRAPALAGLIREALETIVPDEVEEWLARAVEIRETWMTDRVPMADRRSLLRQALAGLVERGNSDDPEVLRKEPARR